MLTSITFASGLFNVLEAASLPTIEYFKTLSTETLACLAVYILILEKPHYRPRIYIGSGTNCRTLRARFYDYDGLRELPRYVEKSNKEGYEIMHKPPLCWIPMPSASLEPKLRLLLVALEATFAYMLWAMRTASRDYGMRISVSATALILNGMVSALIAAYLKGFMATLDSRPRKSRLYLLRRCSRVLSGRVKRLVNGTAIRGRTIVMSISRSEESLEQHWQLGVQRDSEKTTGSGARRDMKQRNCTARLAKRLLRLQALWRSTMPPQPTSTKQR